MKDRRGPWQKHSSAAPRSPWKRTEANKKESWLPVVVGTAPRWGQRTWWWQWQRRAPLSWWRSGCTLPGQGGAPGVGGWRLFWTMLNKSRTRLMTFLVSSTEKKREPHCRSFIRLLDKFRFGTWMILWISRDHNLTWKILESQVYLHWFTCARPGPRIFGWTFGNEMFFNPNVFSTVPVLF